MSKILLALQFYPGDQKAAMSLARLLADLEPRHSDQADMLFAGRFDVKHDREAIAHVARSFNIIPFVSRRTGTGWPHGCNELWFDTMDFCRENILLKKWPAYKAILTFEADCVPLQTDWIERLHKAWDSRTPEGSICAGALLSAPAEHINGNMLISAALPDLEMIRKIGGSAPNAGWDYFIAPRLKRRGWSPIPGIVSYWNMKTCPRDVFDKLRADGVAMLHGCKDMTAMGFARATLLPKKPASDSKLGYSVYAPGGIRRLI